MKHVLQRLSGAAALVLLVSSYSSVSVLCAGALIALILRAMHRI